MGVTAGTWFRFGTGDLQSAWVATRPGDMSFAPLALFGFPLFPIACAMGCILSPLCG